MNPLASIAPQAADCLRLLADATMPGGNDDLRNLPSYGDSLVRMIVVLGVMIALLLLAAKFLPRFLAGRGYRPPTKIIRLVDSYRLEANRSIFIVSVAGQYYLLASSPAGVELLSGPPLDQQQLAQLAAAGLKPQNADKTPTPDSFVDVMEKLRQGPVAPAAAPDAKENPS